MIREEIAAWTLLGLYTLTYLYVVWNSIVDYSILYRCKVQNVYIYIFCSENLLVMYPAVCVDSSRLLEVSGDPPNVYLQCRLRMWCSLTQLHNEGPNLTFAMSPLSCVHPCGWYKGYKVHHFSCARTFSNLTKYLYLCASEWSFFSNEKTRDSCLWIKFYIYNRRGSAIRQLKK